MFFLFKRPLRHRLLQISFLFSFPIFVFTQSNVPDSVLLRTVVIQSNRAGDKSPVPHTNLNARQIAESYQVQDVPMLLSGVPSLVESSDAGTGIGYTGMRIRGSDPTRINVTINGIPLNDAESQGVFWVDLPDLAASASEIQVQRGVGSSTNGAGAFGATVNLDLSRVEAEPFALLSNSVGAFGTRKHSAYVGTGLLSQRVAFSGRLSSIHSDGYIDRARADLQSYHLSGAYVGTRQSLQAHIISGHERTYQAWNGVPAQYLDTLRRFNTAGTEQPGQPYADEVDDYTQRHFLLHYKRLLRQGMNLQINGHYTRGFGFYEQYKAGAAYSDYGLPDWSLPDTTITESDLVRRRWLDNHFYGGTFVLRWAPPVNPPLLAAPPEFMLGGALSRYEGRHYGEIIWSELATVPKDFRYYDNEADKRDANAFFKMELHFRKGFSALIDLQVRRVAYQFLGFDNDLRNVTQTADLQFFNPKAGLNWRFAPRWTAYAFYGIANREPNRDDYTQSSPGSRPQPERLQDLETGLKTGSDDWNVSLNAYHMRYVDQLVLDGRLNDVGGSIRTNVANSYRAGLELEASIRSGRWGLSGNAAFSRNKARAFTEYRDNWDNNSQEIKAYRNTDLAFSPAVIARGEVTFKVLPQAKRQALSLSLAGKYVGKQFLDNTGNENTILPAFFFSDLRLNYDLKELVGQQISLILAVNNLFDARYVSNGWTYRYLSAGYDPRPEDPYSRAEGDGVYNQSGFFPQAGRHWMATLRVEF